ncbi:hypothetical protein D3C84_1228260 [compost metagenome]
MRIPGGAVVGELPLTEADQRGIEAQKPPFTLVPAALIQGMECLSQQQGATQAAADAVEGLTQPLPVPV